ncbi:MAG: hypothetical protein JXI43_08020 [Tissierellales bacterium]|nr:hypothetical protein [Tissierellales bacterium]
MSIDKLSLTVHTILLFHIPAIIFVYFFTLYFSYKASKTKTSITFLTIMASLLLWMVAKVLKTLSPTLELRWFFVVLQYIGVHSLGFLMIHFAFLYTKNRLPSKIFTTITLFLSVGSFIVVLTNPLHHLFYSYFDLYRDRFGPLFIPTQIIQYVLIIYAVFLLILGYQKNSIPYRQKLVGWLLSFFTVAPLAVNVYYILFKLIDIPWIMPFAVFDLTPISISLSLIFFIIPALKLRFLDLRKFVNHHIYNHLSQGILTFSDDMQIKAYNPFCLQRFPFLREHSHFNYFIDEINADLNEHKALYENNTYSFYVYTGDKGLNHCFINDISMLAQSEKELEQKSLTLKMIHEHLQSNSQSKLAHELAMLKSSFAQDLHDIIGHSLTVIIASKKSLLMHTQTSTLKNEMLKLRNLLDSSIQIIQKNTPSTQSFHANDSLEKLFNTLKNPMINVNYIAKGEIIPLSSTKKNTLFRVARESVTNALKHGKAKNIFFIFHYHSDCLKILIHDDGIGAKNITPGMGLNGIQQKISTLKGTLSFASDGNSGFHINITLPK